MPLTMIAVTTRLDIKTRLTRVAAETGLGCVEVHCSAASALASSSDDSVLFLDLSSCCREPALRDTVQGWVRRHSGVEVILFVPLLDREAETRAMFELAALGVGRVMTASDFIRAEIWHTVQRSQAVAAIHRAVESDFCQAIAKIGRALGAADIVLGVLAAVPRSSAPYRPSTGIGLPARSTPAQRKALWLELRRAGQMPVSWLVLTFRVLWYAKLRELGWEQARIASFLGFRTPRHLRVMLKRRFDISMRVLQGVRYSDALTWAAELCTADYRAATGRAAERLMHPPISAGNRPAPSRN